MAKRVNKKFVFLLLGILVVIIAGSFALLYALHEYQNNPVRLRAAARQARGKGDRDRAIALYQRLVVIDQRHGQSSTAARLLVRLGDLYNQTTAAHPHRFQLALQCWRDASQLDYSLLPPRLRLMRAYQQIVRWGRRPADWSKLGKFARAVVRLDPKNAQAWRWRAEARLAAAKGLAELTNARFTVARRDLERAIRLQPQSARLTASLAALDVDQANSELRQTVISAAQAAALRKKALRRLDLYTQKYPHNPYGWIALADLSAELPGHAAAATRALRKAAALAPHDPKVLQAQAQWLIRQPAPVSRIAAILRKIIALQPARMSGYIQLGEFYLQHHEPHRAIPCLEEALQPAAGRRRGRLDKASDHGLRPLLHSAWRNQVQQDLTRANLALAEAATPGSTQRQRYLHAAKTSLGKLMRRAPQSPWVWVYRGRLCLAQGRLASAKRWLNRAAATLSPANLAERPLWIIDQQLQVKLYQLRGESGAALMRLDALAPYWTDQPTFRLDRAALLLAGARPAAALKLINQVLKTSPANRRALILKAQALAQLNDVSALAVLLSELPTRKDLSLALLKTRLALYTKHYAQAWSVLAPWLKKAPADSQLVLYAYAAQMDLHHRTQAAAVIAKAVQLAPDDMQFILLANQLQPGKIPPEIKLTAVSGPELRLTIPGAGAAAVEQAQREAIAHIAAPLQRDLVRAQFEMAHGRLAAATKALAAAAKIQPASTALLAARFRLALLRRDFTLAKHLAAQAAARNLDGCSGALFHARLDLASGAPAAAVRVLRPWCRKHPDHNALQTCYGQALLASGAGSAGITQLRGVLQRQPNNLPAIKMLVGCYLAPGPGQSFVEARKLVQRGLIYAPLDRQLNRWRHDLADIYGPPGPEIARRTRILTARPGDIDNILHLAWLYQRDHRSAAALALLRRTRRGHPGSLAVARELGALYLANRMPAKAQALYSALAESANPHVAFPGRMLLGDFYQNQKDFAAAAQVYQSAWTVQPRGSYTVPRTLGDLFFKLGRFKTALRYYSALYHARPASRRVFLRYVETMIRAGDPAQAHRMLQQSWLNRHPHDEQALALDGFAWYRQGRFPTAAATLERALAMNPRDPLALYYHAAAEVRRAPADPTRAIRDLQTLLALVPQDVRARVLLAQLDVRTGRYAQGVYEYTSVLRTDSGQSQIRRAYARLLLHLSGDYLALAASDRSRRAATLRTIAPLKRLRRWIAQMRHRYPHDAIWWLWQGRYDWLRQRPGPALAAERQAYHLAPGQAGIALAYLAALLQRKQYAQARTTAQQAIVAAPGAPALYAACGRADAGLKKWSACSADFQQALMLALPAPPLFLNLAGQFLATRPYARSRPMVTAVLTKIGLQRAGHEALIDTARGMVAAAGKRWPEVLAHARQALATRPLSGHLDRMLRMTALRLAALGAYQTGRYAAAERYDHALLKLVPDDPGILNNYAYLLAVKFKQPRRAEPFAQRANADAAQEIASGAYCHNSNILDTLGWVRFLNGESLGATAALRRSLRYSPPPVAYYHLAKVLAAQGNPDAARNILQRGIIIARQAAAPILSREQTLLKHLSGPG